MTFTRSSKLSATLSAVAFALLAFSRAEAADNTFNTNITSIFGSGNPASGWTADVDATDGITLALRGKNRTFPGVTTNDGAGNYTFAAGTVGAGYAKWNYEFSIYDATLNTDGVYFRLGIDTDASAAANLTWIDPLTAYGDDSYGTTSTTSGHGGAFVTSDTVVQNSENIKFNGLNPSIPGEYTYVLDAYNAQGQVIASASMNVFTTPDATSTLALCGFGFALLLLPASVRRLKALGSKA